MVLAAARMADIKAGEAPPANLVAELEMYTRQLATQGANEAFFDPLAEFFEATEADGSAQERWFQGLGATFVPRAISQFNQVVKEPAKPEEAAATGLPGPLANLVVGARRQLPGHGQADLGLFGKPREVQTPILSAALGRSGELGNNPIAAEMVRVGAYHLPPNGLSKEFQAGLAKRGLGYTDAEDRLMRQVKGRIQERAVKSVIESPAYANASDAVKKKLIDYAYSRVSSAVDQRVKALKLSKIPITERGILGN
jgi:hypothetical protein